MSKAVVEMSQVISDDVMLYLHISLNIVARTIISIVGVVSNLINTIIFAKLGLKHSMSVGLFCLSLTDLLITGIQLASCISFIVDLLCPNIGTDATFLGYYTLGWPIAALYEASCCITAFVSVERCVCVVSPFKVKQIFTRFRCIVAMMTIYIIYIAIHAPVYVYDRIDWIQTAITIGNNTTSGSPGVMFMISMNEKVQFLEFILDITAGVSMWLVSQAVIIVCAVWMAYSLEASSKVRHNSNHMAQDSPECQPSVLTKHSSLSNRERRLVKVVLFLAVTLTCCNVPKMITTTVYYTFPDANSGRQENLSTLLWTIAITFGSLGCSLNFLVYLKLNANYRRELSRMFTWHTDVSDNTSVNTTTDFTPLDS